jgi:hypothetical protein
MGPAPMEQEFHASLTERGYCPCEASAKQ